MSVKDLLANPLLGLRKADTLCCPQKKNIVARSNLPVMQTGCVHEWFFMGQGSDKNVKWHPPMTLLGAFAVDDAAGGTLVWIGRSCWPTLKLLHDLYGGDSSSTLRKINERCLFIDPRTLKERFWVMEEIVRCRGIHTVIADGSGMTPTISRRLQLSAETGGTTALIARPAWESEQPSWAMTRWNVRPVVAGNGVPRWEITAGKGAWNAQQQWTVEYEVTDGKGSLRVLADVGRGFGSPQFQRRSGTA